MRTDGWTNKLSGWEIGTSPDDLLALETPQDENNIGAGYLFWIGKLMMCCDHLSAGMILFS